MKHCLRTFLNSRTGAYLLLTLSFFISERILILQMRWWVDVSVFQLIRHIVDAALFALPALWCGKRWLTIPWTIIVNIYYLSNIWYFRNYGNFIPLSSLLLFNNLKGLGGNILSSMQWIDILTILPSIPWIATYSTFPTTHNRHNTLVGIISTIIIIGTTSIGYIPKNSELKGPNSVYTTNFDKGFIKYGFVNYWIAQIQ